MLSGYKVIYEYKQEYFTACNIKQKRNKVARYYSDKDIKHKYKKKHHRRMYLVYDENKDRVESIPAKDYEEYFRRPILQMVINQPFGVAKREGAYDVFATIIGGGLSGQAGALKHGISKALALAEPELRTVIKQAGFLTRDSRVVERKHYGHKKARRSFQFSKR